MEPETKPSWSARISSLQKSLRHTLASVLSFFASLWSRFKSPRKKSVEPVHQQNNTNDGGAESNNELRRIVTAESYPPPTITKKQEAGEKRKELREWGALGFQGGTAVVAFLLLVVTCRYVSFTKKIMEATMDQEELGTNPYIDLSRATITAPTFSKENAVILSLWLINTGRTPAKNVRIEKKMAILKSGTRLYPPCIKECWGPTYPSDNRQVTIITKKFTDDERRRYEGGERLYVFGNITYWDFRTFDKKGIRVRPDRESIFCRSFGIEQETTLKASASDEMIPCAPEEWPYDDLRGGDLNKYGKCPENHCEDNK